MTTTLRGSGPAPLGYVTCADPDCSSRPGSHYHPQVAPELIPKDVEVADHRPGFYYVSIVREDGAWGLMRGPFPKHREALQAVDDARVFGERIDPRACWYAWGTCRSETDRGPGVLDILSAERKKPVDARDVGREEGEEDARDFG